MPRVKISRAGSDRRPIEIEVARLRDLDLGELRARWHTVFGRRPPSVICCSVFSPIGFRPMPWAILTETCQRILDRADSLKAAGKQARKLGDVMVTLQQGTILSREWNGRMHRVAVLAGGFAWNGKTYPSLSKVAFAITGTRWNGPRFFGLRDKPTKEARS